jgi:hypothetical protein
VYTPAGVEGEVEIWRVSVTPETESVIGFIVQVGEAPLGKPAMLRATDCGPPLIIAVVVTPPPWNVELAAGLSDKEMVGGKKAVIEPAPLIVAVVVLMSGWSIEIGPVTNHPRKTYPAFWLAAIGTFDPYAYSWVPEGLVDPLPFGETEKLTGHSPAYVIMTEYGPAKKNIPEPSTLVGLKVQPW